MKPRITTRACLDALPSNGPFDRTYPPSDKLAPVSATKTTCFPNAHAQKCTHMAYFTYRSSQRLR